MRIYQESRHDSYIMRLCMCVCLCNVSVQTADVLWLLRDEEQTQQLWDSVEEGNWHVD